MSEQLNRWSLIFQSSALKISTWQKSSRLLQLMSKRRKVIVALFLAFSWAACSGLPFWASIIFIVGLRRLIDFLLHQYMSMYIQYPFKAEVVYQQLRVLSQLDRINKLALRVNKNLQNVQNFERKSNKDQNTQQFLFKLISLNKIRQIIRHIRQTYLRIHVLQPIKTVEPAETIQKGLSLQEEWTEATTLIRAIRDEVHYNWKMAQGWSGLQFKFRIFQLLRNSYQNMIKLNEVTNNSHGQWRDIKNKLNENNKALLKTVQKALKGKRDDGSQQMAQIGYALTVIESQINPKQSQYAISQAHQQIRELIINDPQLENPKKLRINENQPNKVSSVERQIFKSQLNFLLAKGWQQRESKARLEAEQEMKTMQTLQTQIIYDTVSKQYATEGVETQQKHP